MGVCNCSMFCCSLLYVHSSIAIILMGKRELIALLNLSSWCLVLVERLFLAVPRGCLQFVIVVFPDYTHLLFFNPNAGKAIMRAYTNLLISGGKWRQDEGNLLDRKHYLSGSTIFVFQLEPDFSQHSEYMSLVKMGNVRLGVVFNTPLTGMFCT